MNQTIIYFIVMIKKAQISEILFLKTLTYDTWYHLAHKWLMVVTVLDLES